MKKNLRSGYTTGACAAAAAKAAALLLLNSKSKIQNPKFIEIPFPGGSRHKFKIHDAGYGKQDKIARASVIKDAGDDPDVTNGAEIIAEVKIAVSSERLAVSKNANSQLLSANCVLIRGGEGVGIVTKPGLAVPVGEPAINPVPRKMIKEAVMEAINESLKLRVKSYELKDKKGSILQTFEVTISVVNGKELAKKTLNHRLGITGGISILGTTGIVKPVSTEAWTATITSSMDVAEAMGHQEIVISAGRTSERAHMKKFNFPEECYVMMGDYLEFSLLEANKHGFRRIHLCAQWAKMLKIAMATPQTHVRHGAIDMEDTVKFLKQLDSEFPILNSRFNTAREIFDCVNSSFISACPAGRLHPSAIFSKVCSEAKKYAEGITGGISVIGHLVSYDGEVIISCG